ncbi:discoidin domain-containing protein [Thermopirellula anaerolimosa]
MKRFVIAAVVGLFMTTVCGQEPTHHKTDWFAAAKYGVFVHYLDGIQNNPEHVSSLNRRTSWDECVREFNTELFAERMKEAGAGYVIFTVMQVQRFMIAPNAAFDRITGYRPGEACATRDLIDDLARSLDKRGIPLMLYWTGDGPRADPKAAQAMGYAGSGPVSPEFVTQWAEVAAEYGRRYGDRVKGWWVDGCYPWIGYDDEKLGVLAEGLRAGYPDRIVAFNPGVDPRVRAYSKHEDFTTGEQNIFFDWPPSRFIDGKQWHLLAYLGCGNDGSGWGQPGIKMTKRAMADYLHLVTGAGGVVSIDIVLYRDGDVDRSQLEVLKSLRGALAERSRDLDAWREGRAVPPANKAWRKPARMLNLDGRYPLPPSSGVHYAWNGVDGDPHTVAQAANEWAWAYDVHLIRAEKVRRVVIRFGRGYPTEFDVSASLDGDQWTPLGTFTDQTGGTVDLTCEPIQAKVIRIRGLKPNGPNQPGGQMSIAEVEIYE